MRAMLIIGVALLAAGVELGAEDPLSAAKDLYVSAAYEDALSALSTMERDPSAPDVVRQVDQYRMFCLYALGRTSEAESIAESMIRKEPLVRLDTADASPRIEAMFSDVRKRLLPSLTRERFRTARSALDKKSFSDAEPPLTEARLMIVEAEKLGVKDDGLGDLGVLVDGFLQLIRSTAEQQGSARPAPSGAASSVAPRSLASPPPPENGARPPSPSAPEHSLSTSLATPAGGSRVYSLDDEDVSPPIAIDQRMPAMPMEMTLMVKALHVTGVLDILIDETGSVVDATIRRSVNVGFDNAILRSARRWKYRPAMKNGVPVRYVKTLALVP